ncbi:hypothetical protein F5X68DRAFT_264171 [Plectosphaerella plurivora]|uniref:Fungal N-terminal domain-containing protein n=1 Tax=Plectosphaerella plurivora TaxID=936078 RepID=A0A9P8V5I1_9PEZI|nr:hypothetical protein F5X68DRAFT_264171 [Plectosphaerella plurivora]
MEVAASAIAFAQAVGVISIGIKKLRTMQQASVEFMDLLNQLSRFNAQAELLRRALQSLADEGSEFSHLDIELIGSLQGDLAKIGRELDNAAIGLIATSRGIDGEGRHKIRKLQWQKEQSRLVKLRDRARQLSIEMSSCLTAINMAQGIRQRAMVLDVRSFMEASMGNLSSQLSHHGALLLEGTRTSSGQTIPTEDEPGLIRGTPGGTSIVSSDQPQLWLSKLAAHGRQSPDFRLNEASAPYHPTVTISSTLRPAWTPLLKAFSQGYFTLASVLLELGADVSATDNDGFNAVNLAAISAPCRQNPAMLPLTRLVGLNPDSIDTFGGSPIENLALRVQEPESYGWIEIWWVVEMAALILAIREANWEAGLFLDKKVSLVTDGAHARLSRWVTRQRQLNNRDPNGGETNCTAEDIKGWFESDNDSSSCGGSASEGDDIEDDSTARSEEDDEDIFYDASEA